MINEHITLHQIVFGWLSLSFLIKQRMENLGAKLYGAATKTFITASKMSRYWTELCVSFQKIIYMNCIVVVCMYAYYMNYVQFKLVDLPQKVWGINNECGVYTYLIFLMFLLTYFFPSTMSTPTHWPISSANKCASLTIFHLYTRQHDCLFNKTSILYITGNSADCLGVKIFPSNGVHSDTSSFL